MTEWNGEPTAPERLLVIAAHPDDAEFVLAGTVAKWVRAGTVVRYVLATSGDAGTHRLDVTREELTRIREAEQRSAAQVLGVEEVVFLGYPDGMVQPSLDLRRDLVREIRRFRPDMAICFDPTRVFVRGSYINHPDHRAVGQAAIEALSPTAAMPLSFPEHLAGGLQPHRVRQILIASPVQPDTWVDISETLDIKVEALRQHRSQLDLERGDFVGMVRQWAIDAGAEVGLPYAESFMRIVRPASRRD